ncbi:L-fucose isomerase [Clostridium sp. AM58-1XD]|uniref:L-fucose/L-arabinose isomerase family protein n=1 Tax=Clostridium sp. AM58-1XD TaxID=2292307 RepID=UPI000E5338C6|nr:L-fucose isomerase [Clostridium sp. AM58-1XD]RGZ00651.1 L-fucose isomerase [Clostridium sp. AM58-1XD]
MSKIRVGILSFSDGRASVHEDLSGYIADCSLRIRTALEKTGEVIICGSDRTVSGNGQAREYALELKAELPDAVIFNVPVFAFPNFSLIAASVLKLPVLVISNVNGGLPGLGGLQAASSLMRQCGYYCEKVWGDIEDQNVLARCMHFLRAAHAVTDMAGQTFGLIGGRSIGMGSGTASADRWQQVFGVDIDHMDQSEILRRAELVPEDKVERAAQWLKDRVSIAYDSDKLTEESLRQQIRHYYATKDICEEKDYAFVGVKCHYELSAYYCTQCLAAAFFNDPYDWDGPKETRVFTCEADAEGGLTMQVMKEISGLPVIFSDFRYYSKKKNLFYFCNCGAMATWYAGQSSVPEENLKKVTLKPIIPKYAGKGCHVEYIAAGGQMTFGRITHTDGKFVFSVFTGQAKEMPESMLKATCEQWPHMFVEPDVSYEKVIESYDCNHIHGVLGNYVEEIRYFCEMKGIEFNYIHE